jgi:hypothetical protein
MPSNDPWAAVDDAVLEKFRDGHARSAREVYRMLPDLTQREICHALDANAQKGRLAEGELTYVITEAGRRHLTNTKAMA